MAFFLVQSKMMDSRVINVLLVVLDAQYLKAHPGKAALIALHLSGLNY
jgi:hypothetical protein